MLEPLHFVHGVQSKDTVQSIPSVLKLHGLLQAGRNHFVGLKGVGCQTVETGGVRTPTSRGSNLLGDSPSVLPLTEAESDISVLEWKEEMEELVSSVMEEKKGILSAWMVGGEGHLLWKVSELRFTTIVV